MDFGKVKSRHSFLMRIDKMHFEMIDIKKHIRVVHLSLIVMHAAESNRTIFRMKGSHYSSGFTLNFALLEETDVLLLLL